jgi:hypothetical protein
MKYFADQTWSDITREERLFCAELFFQYRDDAKKLIAYLKSIKTITCLDDIDLKSEWELGYEVCFYRDLLHYYNKKTGINKVSIKDYYQKRTFDLCLFSDRKIIVIEAKVQQGFDTKQIEYFNNDSKLIPNLFNNIGHTKPLIFFLGLASSKYFINAQKYGNGIPELFKANYISWIDFYNSAIPRTNIFKKADNLYKN